MKIAIIRKNYSPYGGAEKFISNIIENFKENKIEVHIYTNSWEDIETSDYIFIHNVPVFKFFSFLKVLSFAINTKKVIKLGTFDVIFSFERTIHQDIYRAGDGCHIEWMKQRNNNATILEKIFLKTNLLDKIILSIEKKIFTKGRYKKIIANSKRGKDEIISHYNVPEKDIEVIYNGVDLEKFTPRNKIKYKEETLKLLNLSENDLIILFTGSGFKRKGLKFAILALFHALNKKSNTSFKLLVAGKGKTSRYKQLAKSLEIEQNVVFLGPVNDIERYYASADIFLFPTIYEPFSNACCEAMASGLPIITSKISGISELITHGVNGLLIDKPKDSEKLANCILDLIAKEERMKIGKNARATIEKYPQKKQNKKILDLLTEFKKV